MPNRVRKSLPVMQSPRLADAEIARRLAEVHRHQLPVHIGDMQQRDIAEWLEREQFGLRQPLLCQRARPAVGENGSSGCNNLKKFAAGEHHACLSSRPSEARAGNYFTDARACCLMGPG
jgi:hypothetical protein